MSSEFFQDSSSQLDLEPSCSHSHTSSEEQKQQKSSLKVVNRKHDLIGIRLFDPAEITFPNLGVVKVELDGSNFNINVTNTSFTANHNEADDGTQLAYNAAYDSDNDTSFMVGGANVGNDNDQGVCGYLYLFNPSSTTFVKHYISRNHSYGATNYARSFFVSGYFDTTSAVTGMQFKFASSNMDTGTIKLYGVK